jgi:hypothetical protein
LTGLAGFAACVAFARVPVDLRGVRIADVVQVYPIDVVVLGHLPRLDLGIRPVLLPRRTHPVPGPRRNILRFEAASLRVDPVSPHLASGAHGTQPQSRMHFNAELLRRLHDGREQIAVHLQPGGVVIGSSPGRHDRDVALDATAGPPLKGPHEVVRAVLSFREFAVRMSPRSQPHVIPPSKNDLVRTLELRIGQVKLVGFLGSGQRYASSRYWACAIPPDSSFSEIKGFLQGSPGTKMRCKE